MNSDLKTFDLVKGDGEYGIVNYVLDRMKDTAYSLFGTLVAVGSVALNILTLRPKHAAKSLACLVGSTVNIGAQIAKGVLGGLGFTAVRVAGLAGRHFGWNSITIKEQSQLFKDPKARLLAIAEKAFHGGYTLPCPSSDDNSSPCAAAVAKVSKDKPPAPASPRVSLCNNSAPSDDDSLMDEDSDLEAVGTHFIGPSLCAKTPPPPLAEGRGISSLEKDSSSSDVSLPATPATVLPSNLTIAPNKRYIAKVYGFRDLGESFANLITCSSSKTQFDPAAIKNAVATGSATPWRDQFLAQFRPTMAAVAKMSKDKLPAPALSDAAAVAKVPERELYATLGVIEQAESSDELP